MVEKLKKISSKYAQVLKELGASLVGFSIAAVLIITFAIVIIDYARVRWIETSVRHALSQTLKKSLGDERLSANIWNTEGSSKVSTYKEARDSLNTFFTNSPEFRNLRQSVTFKTFTYAGNNTSGDPGTVATSGQAIAYLPPGYQATVPSLDNLTVGNSQKASRAPSSETLRALAQTYPTEAVAYIEVPTLFFGRKNVEVRVAGFPRVAVTEGAPVVTTTTTTVTGVLVTTTTATTTTRTTTTATTTTQTTTTATTTTRTTTTATTTTQTTTTATTTTQTTTSRTTTTQTTTTQTTTTRTTTTATTTTQTTTTATTTTRTTTTATTTTRTTTTATTTTRTTTTATTTTATSTTIPSGCLPAGPIACDRDNDCYVQEIDGNKCVDCSECNCEKDAFGKCIVNGTCVNLPVPRAINVEAECAAPFNKCKAKACIPSIGCCYDDPANPLDGNCDESQLPNAYGADSCQAPCYSCSPSTGQCAYTGNDALCMPGGGSPPPPGPPPGGAPGTSDVCGYPNVDELCASVTGSTARVGCTGPSTCAADPECLNPGNGGLPQGVCEVDSHGATFYVSCLIPDLVNCTCYSLCYKSRSPGGCFDPATKILMANMQWVEIKDIEKGDYVWNPVRQKKAKVLKIVAGEEKHDLYEVGFGDLRMLITEKHPVVTTEGVKLAYKLTVDDTIIDWRGSGQKITHLKTVPTFPGQVVINIEIEGDSIDWEDHSIVANGILSGDLALQMKYSEEEEQ